MPTVPFLAGVLAVLCACGASVVHAAGKSPEEMAAQAARAHNAQQISDEMLVSSRASAVGRRVLFRNIVRVRKGPSDDERTAFLFDVRSALVARICAADRDAVKSGVSYTWVYDNTWGERVAEVHIDEKTCGVH
jgi:hypothetical protein